MTIFVSLGLIFLLWAFVLTTFTHSIVRLGEVRTQDFFKKFSSHFFYYSVHRWLFKNKSFELLIFSSALGENIAKIGYSVVVIVITLSLSLTYLHKIILLFLLFSLILLIGDFLPRLWATRHTQKFLKNFSSLASFFLLCSLPISFVFLKFAAYALKSLKKDTLENMKESIVNILHTANVTGELNNSDKKLIKSVVKFKDKIVREVMVPRIDLFSLSGDSSIRDSARAILYEGYSRIPVYSDTIDHIIGVLMFKDVVEVYMDCVEGRKDKSILDEPVKQLVKNVFYTPETKKVSVLLQEFRSKQMHMAIVVDEYGGTEGVVTMEDILEEIVGEIEDEYDEDEEELYTTQVPGESWIVDARMTISDAEETFHIQIPQEGDYDTLGGYIFHNVGAIPQKGLKIHQEDFDLEILSVSERSVEKVLITSRIQKQS